MSRKTHPADTDDSALMPGVYASQAAIAQSKLSGVKLPKVKSMAGYQFIKMDAEEPQKDK